MNILIDNYIDQVNTESLYLYHEFLKLKNINTYYWNSKSISTYDILDQTTPNIFIGHVGTLNQDFISYIYDNKIEDNLLVVLSVRNIPYTEIKKIEENMPSSIKLILMADKDIKTKIKNFRLNNAVDSNIIPQNFGDNINIPIAYFINNSADIEKHTGSYHYISNTVDSVDICLPEIHLAKFYHNYEKIIFKNIRNFDQAFFDAIYYGNKVVYTTQNNEIDELSNKLFGQILNEQNNNIDYIGLKKIMKEKHMSYNRAKTLLSQLPINQNIFRGEK